MSGITRDDWMRALTAAENQPLPEQPDLLTVVEFADLMQISRQSSARRLRDMAKLGLVERAKKLIRRADGSLMNVMCYRLLKPVPGGSHAPTPRRSRR